MRTWIVSSLAVAFAACTPMQQGGASGAAQSQQDLSSSVCPAGTPAALAPAADQALWRVFSAEGVQIYRCTLGTNGAYAWVFDSPDALLYGGDWDDEGDLPIVAHHYAGPTWEYKDHSGVVGTKVAAATPDATAIPWLLLTAKSHFGTGKFTEVTTVQRLNTTGGVAPASGCDATTVGTSLRVPYTADYFMYRTRAGDNSAKQCG